MYSTLIAVLTAINLQPYIKLVLPPQMGQGIMRITVGEFHFWNWVGTLYLICSNLIIAAEWMINVACCVAWNELLIALLAYQSTATNDCIMLARGLYVYRSNAHQLGFGQIFDRILAELVYKMRELAVDRTELGCLRSIILFNPGIVMCCCNSWCHFLL